MSLPDVTNVLPIHPGMAQFISWTTSTIQSLNAMNNK